MKLLPEQKVKILENRKKLIEKILGSMNESIMDSIMETMLFEKAPRTKTDVTDVVDQDKLKGNYWDRINKKSANWEAGEKVDQDKLVGDYWKNLNKKDEKAPEGFLNKLGKKMRQGIGRVDPSVDVDDPGFTKQNVVKSIKKTKSQLDNFQKTALNTTKNIDNLHTKISDLINKFDKFAETLPQEMRGKAEREVVGLAKKFYQLLDQEKGRIDSYMDMMKSDISTSGREGAITEESHVATYDEIKEYSKKLQEESNEHERLTLSWGALPSLEELEKRMGDEDFNMKLGKQDKLAWDYVMTLSGEPYRSPDKITNSVDMYDILEMLIGAPVEQELSSSELEKVAEILEEWHENYEDEEISETAESLASSILEVLSVEWV